MAPAWRRTVFVVYCKPAKRPSRPRRVGVCGLLSCLPGWLLRVPPLDAAVSLSISAARRRITQSCLPGWLLCVPRPSRILRVGVRDLLPRLCGWLQCDSTLSRTQQCGLLVHMGCYGHNRVLLPCLPGWLLCVATGVDGTISVDFSRRCRCRDPQIERNSVHLIVVPDIIHHLTRIKRCPLMRRSRDRVFRDVQWYQMLHRDYDGASLPILTVSRTRQACGRSLSLIIPLLPRFLFRWAT